MLATLLLKIACGPQTGAVVRHFKLPPPRRWYQARGMRSRPTPIGPMSFGRARRLPPSSTYEINEPRGASALIKGTRFDKDDHRLAVQW